MYVEVRQDKLAILTIDERRLSWKCQHIKDWIKLSCMYVPAAHVLKYEISEHSSSLDADEELEHERLNKPCTYCMRYG